MEDLKGQKQALFEQYLLGQIELDAYKSEKAVYDAEILKVKNAYAAVTAQAKLKRGRTGPAKAAGKRSFTRLQKRMR